MKRLVAVSLALLLAPPLCLRANPELTDSSLRIQGIFNAQLPGTEKKSSLRLIVHPRLGDLSNRAHIRTPLGLRYGLTENWEATLDVESYFSHGLKEVPFLDDAGFSQIHFGTKYRLGHRPFTNWDTAVGLDYTHPLGSPPSDISDGLVHIAPYFTLARPLARHPDVRVFWGLGANLVNRTFRPVTPGKNELGDDTATLSGGLVWRVAPCTYTLETSWTTSDRIGGPLDGNVVSLRPGVVWEVPQRYTFGAKGQWLLGFGLRATRGPDGADFGATAKVRLNFDFKRLLGRKKAPASAP
ncbi:MAG: hypothetical protein C0502_02280 [Opitutus sp.]|nr:hypothetical protein [Opitutus sp.]